MKSRSRETGGIGLGLSIAKHTAQRLGVPKGFNYAQSRCSGKPPLTKAAAFLPAVICAEENAANRI